MYKNNQNFIVPCSNIDCSRGDACPNFSKKLKNKTFNFPDCIERIKLRNKSKQLQSHI